MGLRRNYWLRSSKSANNGACVEAGVWNKSSRSGGAGECVETTATNHIVLVRDTKVSSVIGDDAPTLAFTLIDWDTIQGKYIEIAKAAAANKVYNLKLRDGNTFKQTPTKTGFTWTKSGTDVTLDYTPKEIAAWIGGAELGEFELGDELQPELKSQKLALAAA